MGEEEEACSGIVPRFAAIDNLGFGLSRFERRITFLYAVGECYGEYTSNKASLSVPLKMHCLT